MKLKLDDKGNVVLQDGKPVYVHDDGKEIPFDAPAAMSKISALNAEAKDHRIKAEEATAKLAIFAGIDDPEAAKKAVELVKNLDAKKLIDAGEVEKMKDEIRAETTKSYEVKLADMGKQLQDKDGIIYAMKVSGGFANSTFVKDKVAIPSDLLEAKFGSAFKVEDGRVVGYLNGNKVYSRSKPGELADFDEALETILDAYPQKEAILKGTGATGGGAPNNPNPATVTPPGAIAKTDQKAFLANLDKVASGEMKVV